MSEYFYADKANRNAAFHFENGLGSVHQTDSPAVLMAAENGDQSSRVHPIPAVLGTRQKVGGDIVGEAGYESADAEQSGRQPGNSVNDAVNNR